MYLYVDFPIFVFEIKLIQFKKNFYFYFIFTPTSYYYRVEDTYIGTFRIIKYFELKSFHIQFSSKEQILDLKFFNLIILYRQNYLTYNLIISKIFETITQKHTKF